MKLSNKLDVATEIRIEREIKAGKRRKAQREFEARRKKIKQLTEVQDAPDTRLS